jgi:hypothetical protein
MPPNVPGIQAEVRQKSHLSPMFKFPEPARYFPSSNRCKQVRAPSFGAKACLFTFQSQFEDERRCRVPPARKRCRFIAAEAQTALEGPSAPGPKRSGAAAKRWER